MRQVRINQITGSYAEPHTSAYEEREGLIDEEAIRLGFKKEIDALNNE